MKEAAAVALDKEQGWSSTGENSDGGRPVIPVPSIPGSKKGTGAQNRSGRIGSSKPTEGSWRPAKPSGNYKQGQNYPREWVTKTVPAAWDIPNSSLSGTAALSAGKVANLEDTMRDDFGNMKIDSEEGRMKDGRSSQG